MNFTEKDEKKEWFLASPVQYRVYMSDIVEPGKTRYNATVRITYEGKIQKEKLIKAIDDSLSRIDILRAQFRYESGKLEYYISNRKSDVEIIEYDSDMNIEELKEYFPKDDVKELYIELSNIKV